MERFLAKPGYPHPNSKLTHVHSFPIPRPILIPNCTIITIIRYHASPPIYLVRNMIFMKPIISQVRPRWKLRTWSQLAYKKREHHDIMSWPTSPMYRSATLLINMMLMIGSISDCTTCHQHGSLQFAKARWWNIWAENMQIRAPCNCLQDMHGHICWQTLLHCTPLLLKFWVSHPVGFKHSYHFHTSCSAHQQG